MNAKFTQLDEAGDRIVYVKSVAVADLPRESPEKQRRGMVTSLTPIPQNRPHGQRDMALTFAPDRLTHASGWRTHKIEPARENT